MAASFSNDNQMNFFNVGIVADKSEIIFRLVNLLGKKNCLSILVSKGFPKRVNEKLKNFKVISPQEKEKLDFIKFDYLIFFILSGEKPETLGEKIALTIELAEKNKCKTLFILPYQHNKETYKFFLEVEKNVLNNKSFASGIIYLAILRDEFEENLKKIIIGRQEGDIFENNIFLLSEEKVSEEVIKKLFSLSAYGKKTALISTPLEGKSLLSQLKKIYSLPKTDFFIQSKKTVVPEVDKTIVLESSPEDIFKKILDDISNKLKTRKPAKSLKIKSLVFGRQQIRLLENFSLGKRLKQVKSVKLKLLTTAVFLALFPLIFLLISLSTLFISRRSLEKGNLVFSQKLFEVSYIMSSISRNSLEIFEEIPYLGSLYKSAKDFSLLLKDFSIIGIDTLDIGLETAQTFDLSVQAKDYQLANKSRLIGLKMENLYKELGFLDTETEVFSQRTGQGGGKVINLIRFPVGREKVLSIRKIVAELPNLLGQQNTKTYLVLLQNNNLQTPSGGLIESFGLVNFFQGRLESFRVYPTEYADQKIKGIVEAPLSLKYKDPKNWYLKESGIDPNFSVSASKAEWFLDKSLDQSVDGVIALDLSFIKDVFERVDRHEVEPINLDNINTTSFDDYPKDLESTLASDLLETFFDKIKKLSFQKKVVFLKLVEKSLEEKHIQVFLHNQNAHKYLSDLNWDGGMKTLSCNDNCYSDFVSFIETNLGGAGSRKINREFQLSVSLEERLIKRTFFLFLENKSDKGYQGYFRLFVNPDSGFGQIEVVGEAKSFLPKNVFASGGFKEVGFFLELLPQETKALKFSWEGSTSLIFDKEGEYKIFWRKQAGNDETPVELNLKVSSKLRVGDKTNLSLTRESLYGYNTVLIKDFFSSLHWKE